MITDINLVQSRFNELLAACQNGDIKTVKDICSVKEHINAQNNRGWSPLMGATYNNKKDVVLYLISVGANI